MKKLFTLCSAVLFAITAVAQVDETFQFVDAAGNVVADGTTIVVNTLNENGQMVIPLRVRNASGEKQAVSMYETIEAKPNGDWQTCAFGNCMQLTETGYSPKNIMSADYEADIMTEWMPETGKYATWEAALQIHVFNITKQSKFGQVIESAGNEIIGYGPKVTVRFEYKNPDATASGTWWGYVPKDASTSLLGTEDTETYDCAIFVPASHVIAGGKTIQSIHFKLNSQNVSNVKVWLNEGSRPTDVDQATQVVSVANPVTGENEVRLTTPYTIGSKGVYVGYSFTVDKVSDRTDKYPIVIVPTSIENAFWMRSSKEFTKWTDLSGSYGSLYLQLFLEGDFYENAVIIDAENIGDYTAALGGTATIYLPVTNIGTTPITSLEYTIDRERGSIDLSSASIPFGRSSVISLTVDADATVGGSIKSLTINKVNGKKIENGSQQTGFSLITVGKIVERAIAAEQFTGTQCGWCPRGIAGMKKLREKYGDKFVGAAVHGYANGTSDDAMYLTNFRQRYAPIFGGSAPSLQLNRAYGEIDPYYGTGNDICKDFENQLSIPARVGITLKGKWNADSTQVTATASLDAVVDGQSYTIEYALVADGLTGTGTPWTQHNYYADRTSSDPDIAPFCRGGEYGRELLSGWTFNDVVIATCYSDGKNLTTAPGTLSVGTPVTNTYTLNMPSDNAHSALIKAIDKSKVSVIALVIAADGSVANAAKFLMSGKVSGSGDVNGDGTVDVADISNVISVMAAGTNDAAADVNGDKTVDVADISAVITIMAGK